MTDATVETIDVHAHLFPQSAVAAVRGGRDWFGIEVDRTADGRPVATLEGRTVAFGSPRHVEAPETRIERMDAIGVDRQLVSLLPPLYQYGRSGAGRLAALRAVNDEIAGMIDAHPDRFGGLAALPLPDIDQSLAELDRVLGLGFAGISIGTHVNGENLDTQLLRPVLQAAEQAQALVFIHPIFPRCGDAVGRHYLHNLIGNPYETTVAVASLILGGVLDELPDLRLCLAHGGGYLPHGIGRIAHGARVRSEIGALQRSPDEVMRTLYYDTLTHSEGALRFLVEQVGDDHVVLGTDYPSDMGDGDPVARLMSYDWLSDDARRRILGLTARGLMPSIGQPVTPA